MKIKWLQSVFLALSLLAPRLGLQAQEILSSQGAVSQKLSLFDGKTLSGWHFSDSSIHGNTTAWTVLNTQAGGEIHGGQDRRGNGGLLLTNQEYGDFELTLEIKPGAGSDSGIFLRSSEGGKAYQVNNHIEDSVGGISGERMGRLGLEFDRFAEARSDWQEYFRPDQWNKMKVRIVGNPPRITTWLNGKKIAEFRDDKKRAESKGYIGFQVHRGWIKWSRGAVTRYRNIEVELIDSAKQ